MTSRTDDDAAGRPKDGDRAEIGRTTADQDDRMPKRGEPAEQAVPEPDATRASDRGGTGGWGSEGSGGSVIDKRSPEKRDR